MSRVLDASLFVAVLTPAEHHHQVALTAYQACDPADAFLVPAIFPLEVLAALARQGASAHAMRTAEALVRSRRFMEVAIDRALLDQAMVVAVGARLRAADALYAALALSRGAALMTLDGEMSTRLGAAYPALRIQP